VTVIVAARTANDGICIASDSLTSSGWEKLQLDRSKVWVSNPYVIGAAGCVRTSQVVRHFASWPKFRPDEDTDIEAFLVKSVAPAIKDATKDAGVEHVKDGVVHLNASFIVAWGDYLAEIAGNRAVCVPQYGRHAIGSGYAEALGFLGKQGPWTIDQVVEAARRATISADGCEGPIDYATTKGLAVVHGALPGWDAEPMPQQVATFRPDPGLQEKKPKPKKGAHT